jgi:formyltetrahydrofolate deformylase
MKNNAILLISCPDRKGIVASVSQFLYHHGANIIHADQHLDQELNLFFMRIEWSLDGFSMSIERFKQNFIEIALKFKMNWRIVTSNDHSKLAVFVSKQDHCLADLLHRYHQGELSCDIKLVISNHPNAEKLANFYNIPYYEIPMNKNNRKTSERKILFLLKKYNIDLGIIKNLYWYLSPN